MKKKILVEGMSCTHCVNHVVMALKEAGAQNMDVNLDAKFAVAEISEGITDEAIKRAIEEAGYFVVGIEEV